MNVRFLAVLSLLLTLGCSKGSSGALIDQGADEEGDGGGGEGNGDPTVPTLPTLTLTADTPPPWPLMMGSDTPLLCFRLTAKGANLNARLPRMTIEAVDGGRVVTNSLSGLVFEGPYIEEGAITHAIPPIEITTNTEGSIAYLDDFRLSWLELIADEPMFLCIKSSIVSWSATPTDFYGRSYRIIMEDWGDDDVLSLKTNTFLSREQILAPQEMAGPTLTIAGESHPEYFTGALTVSLGAALPVNNTASPGEQKVVVLPITFTANGSGACVRGIDVTDHGTGQSSNVSQLYLFDKTDGTIVTSANLENGKATLGWHQDHLLFCLEGGETRNYFVLADFSDTAVPGDVHSFWIEDPTVDVDRVSGTVQGPLLIGGTFTIVPAP